MVGLSICKSLDLQIDTNILTHLVLRGVSVSFVSKNIIKKLGDGGRLSPPQAVDIMKGSEIYDN